MCTRSILCAGILLTAAALANAQQRLTIEPTATRTWQQMQDHEAELRAAGRADEPRDIPEGKRPAPKAVGFSRARGAAQPPGAAVRQPTPPGQRDDCCVGGSNTPPLTTNFQGLADNNAAIPPDTMGAVGPRHVMTMLNTQVHIQDRDGNSLGAPVSLNAFWSGLSFIFTFDPKVYFDPLSRRWFAVVDSDAFRASSSVLFAISDTDDPTGAWRFYQIDADPLNQTWADYPSVGFNNDWIVISQNMFSNFGSSYAGVKMWAIRKASALAGGPIQVQSFEVGFDIAPPPPDPNSVFGFTMLPCLTYDADEPNLYIVDNFYLDTDVTPNQPLIRLSRLVQDGIGLRWEPLPGSSLAGTGLFETPLLFSFFQPDAAQRDGGPVATNDPRVLSAVYRNGHIWLSHTGGLPATGSANRTSIFWYRLNPGGMPAPVVDANVIDSGPGISNYFPSLAVNCGNDFCIGFSRSSSMIYVQAMYAVRLGSDATEFVQLGSLKSGESAYFKTFSGSENRWGDYSATMVDPVDDRSFWTLQQYAAQRVGPNPNDSRWGVWWGYLPTLNGNLPVINVQPAPQAVCLGEAISLSVNASAGGALEYQWTRDGIDLTDDERVSGATGPNLTISPAIEADAGAYRCRVTRIDLDLCTLSNTVPVGTISPATVTNLTGPYQACAAAESVPVSGTVNNAIASFWTTTGDGSFASPSSPTTDYIPGPADRVNGTVDLTLTAVSTPPCSREVSVTTTLTLRPILEAVDAGGPYVLCDDAASIVITGTAANAGGVTWRSSGDGGFGNASVLSTTYTPGANDRRLGRIELTLAATPIPPCLGAASDTATVSILASPSFSVSPTDQTVCEGETVQLVALTSGRPAPTFQWLRDGQPLSNSSSISGANGATLTITPVTANDAGSYSLRLTNPCGTRETSMMLNVRRAPRTTAPRRDLTRCIGDSVTLEADIDGTEPLTWVWTRNGQAIGGGSQPRLTLTGLTAADTGLYAVRASNACGNMVRDVAVLTVARPEVCDPTLGFQGCPPDLVLAATSAAGATVQFAPPTVVPSSPNVVLSASHPPGSVFPIGDTQVTFSVTDTTTGLTRECTFKISVLAPGSNAPPQGPPPPPIVPPPPGGTQPGQGQNNPPTGPNPPSTPSPGPACFGVGVVDGAALAATASMLALVSWRRRRGRSAQCND